MKTQTCPRGDTRAQGPQGRSQGPLGPNPKDPGPMAHHKNEHFRDKPNPLTLTLTLRAQGPRAQGPRGPRPIIEMKSNYDLPRARDPGPRGRPQGLAAGLRARPGRAAQIGRGRADPGLENIEFKKKETEYCCTCGRPRDWSKRIFHWFPINAFGF